MFLHIGGDVVIPLNELIIILNLESVKKQEATREFFGFAQQESFAYQIGKKGNEESAVITKKRLYYSPIFFFDSLEKGAASGT